MRSLPPAMLAQNLLGVLMGIRVLARVRPERALIEGVVGQALALLRFGPAPRLTQSRRSLGGLGLSARGT